MLALVEALYVSRSGTPCSSAHHSSFGLSRSPPGRKDLCLLGDAVDSVAIEPDPLERSKHLRTGGGAVWQAEGVLCNAAKPAGPSAHIDTAASWHDAAPPTGDMDHQATAEGVGGACCLAVRGNE